MTKRIVTALKKQKRRQGRISLFLDGQFFCGLDEKIVWDLDLKKGQGVNERKLKQILVREELSKAKNYSLNLLTYRPRSIKEIKDKLSKKEYPEVIIELVIEELKSLNFLDDLQFAELWTKSRLLGKPVGKRRLEQELYRKGIAEDIITKVSASAYASEKEAALALELAKKWVKKNRTLSSQTAQRRLYGYLGRRGFSFENISESMEKVLVKKK